MLPVCIFHIYRCFWVCYVVRMCHLIVFNFFFLSFEIETYLRHFRDDGFCSYLIMIFFFRFLEYFFGSQCAHCSHTLIFKFHTSFFFFRSKEKKKRHTRNCRSFEHVFTHNSPAGKKFMAPYTHRHNFFGSVNYTLHTTKWPFLHLSLFLYSDKKNNGVWTEHIKLCTILNAIVAPQTFIK